MQKARRHILLMLRPLVGVWFQGLFHLSFRNTFHLSLTVLVRYRSSRSIQPWRMVPPYSDRISRVPPYSFSYVYRFHLRDYHPLRLSFPKHSVIYIDTFGLFRFRSPLLSESLLISFPLPTQMFQFGRFASPYGNTILLYSGLPHSDICGSFRVCQSPQLFAAYHVFLRLLKPRHPPYALNDFFSLAFYWPLGLFFLI